MTTTPASLTLRLLTMAGTTARLGLERVLTLAGIRSVSCLHWWYSLKSFFVWRGRAWPRGFAAEPLSTHFWKSRRGCAQHNRRGLMSTQL